MIDDPQCIDGCDIEKLYSLVGHTGSLYTEKDEDDAKLHVRLLNLQLHEAHMSIGEVFASSVRLMQFLSHTPCDYLRNDLVFQKTRLAFPIIVATRSPTVR